MAPHSSTLAWRILWMEEPGRLQSMGSLRVGHNWATSLSLSCIGEGNGTPLQCSCLENPRDRGTWWAAIYGVAQSHDWSDLAAAAQVLIIFNTFILMYLILVYFIKLQSVMVRFSFGWTLGKFPLGWHHKHAAFNSHLHDSFAHRFEIFCGLYLLCVKLLEY